MNKKYIVICLISFIFSISYGKNIDDFVSNMNSVLIKPVNQCSISNNFNNLVINDKWSDSTIIDFDIFIHCHNKATNEYMIQIMKDYKSLLDSNFNSIDSAILLRYPDLAIYYGNNLNGSTVFFINSKYNKSSGNDNKQVYFNLTINNFNSPIFLASFTGHMLSIYDEKNEQITVFHYKVKIPKNTLYSDSENNITINRIWHINQNNKIIHSKYETEI